MTWPILGANIPSRKHPVRTAVGRLIFRLMGWRVTGELPNEPKLIIVALPHSSNIDFILAISIIWGWGLKVNFIAKHTLFKFPHGFFFRAVGGIPVDRRSAQGLIETMANEFRTKKQLMLGIAPEGTRNSDGTLKAGFARIAKAASVPIIPAIVNYKQRTVQFGQVISDVTNVEKVIATVSQQATYGERRAPAKL